MDRRRFAFPARRSARAAAAARRPSRFPSLGAESLEPRALLAVTVSLDANNDLLLQYGAADDVATISNDDTNISVSYTGDGGTPFTTAAANVTGIRVTDSGSFGNQSLTFATGATISLSNGLSSTGVENVSFNSQIDASGGSSAISIDAPTSIVVLANMTGGSGGVSLIANSGGTAAGKSTGITIGDGSTTPSVTVATKNNGAISLLGKGAENGRGVDISNGGAISADGSGTVTITGAGGSGSAYETQGFWSQGTRGPGMASGVAISSGTGKISITGDASASKDTSFTSGVDLGLGTTITTGGDVAITAAGTASSHAVYTEADITAGTGKSVTVRADSAFLAGGSVKAASGTVSLETRSAGTLIDLGGDDVFSGSLVLGLTDAEIDTVTAGTLVVGKSDSGAITVSKGINPANASNLGLKNGSTITINDTLTVGGTGNLALTSGGAISQAAALSVGGTTTIDAGLGNGITLDQSGNEFDTLTITGGGNVTVAEANGFTIGGISGIGAGTITVSGAGTVAATGAITTTGGILLQGLTAAKTIGVAGASGDAAFAASVFTNLTNGASGVTIGNAAQTGNITVNAVTLKDPATIRATGTGGSITVNGAITGTDDASVTLSASPTTITLNNDITTANQQIVLDGGKGGATAVVLGKDVTLSAGNGAITINGTVDGDSSLSLKSSGATTLGGAVGGGTPLKSLTTDADGTVSLKNVTTSGAQSYGDNATLDGTYTTTDSNFSIAGTTTLAGNVTVNTGAGAGDITFTGAIDGAKQASLAAGAGAILFKSTVGSTTPLAGLTLSSAASTTAESTVKLASGADSGQDGLSIAAGVNNVSMTSSGSSVAGFTRDGVTFLGGSTNSLLSGFDVSDNGDNGMRFAAGSYAGTVIAANTIRDNGDSVTHVGNGILVEGSDLMIGWTATAGQTNTVANTITGNAKNGIEIRGAAAQNNTILSNSIFLNGYVDTTVTGVATVVGEGIALSDGGNGGQVAPQILRVVDDATDGVLRVHVIVPSAGSYYVQLFDNTPADERNIFPSDTEGFEGRTYVGDSPAQSGGSVTTGKPAIEGVLVVGDTPTIIEIPSGRVPPGNWLSATATRMSDVTTTTPTNTSPFSVAVQRPDAPTLAVGGDAPASWAREYAYTSGNPNSIVITGLTPAAAGSLAALGGSGIPLVITPVNATAGGNVIRTVRRATRTGTRVVLSLTPAAPGTPALGASGTFVIGSATLPAARLYDVSARNTIMDFTAGAGGTTVTVAGDQTSQISVDQTVAIVSDQLRGNTVLRTIKAVALTGGTTVLTLSAPIDSATTAGKLVIDAYRPSLDVDGEMIGRALQNGTMSFTALTAAQANAFANRFQGGLRVSGADIDGDGFADLATAPGAVPTAPKANTPVNNALRKSLKSFTNAVGDAPRVITIYNGNPAGSWESASINVSAVFGATYTGGFLVTFGNVRPENAGSGSAVAELIVASSDKVAVFNVEVSTRGGAPTITDSGASATVAAGRQITGLAAGDFSSAAHDQVVVATALANGVPSTTVVQLYNDDSGSLMPGRTFSVSSLVEQGPDRKEKDVFLFGASLAVGDIDGGAPEADAKGLRYKPELLLGASVGGLANFRVLSNQLVAAGLQGDIDAALKAGNGFTNPSRSTVTGWQPTGGPDYFTGMSDLPKPTALNANAPIALAVVDADGKTTARAEVFAALGATSSTVNAIRRIRWSGSSWDSGPKLVGDDTIIVQPNGGSATKTRFTVGFGLRLG